MLVSKGDVQDSCGSQDLNLRQNQIRDDTGQQKDGIMNEGLHHDRGIDAEP